MFIIRISTLLFSILSVHCIQIPFIQNVTLIPRYKSNSTTIINITSNQCLCMSMPSFVAFNYFPNNICQLFYTFPITYKIQSTAQARLYFPQRIFPNVSQCCMPDLAYLLDKLKNGSWSYVNVTAPRNLLMDNHGYIVTAEMNPPKIDRSDAQNLTLISRTSITGSYLMAITFTNNTYFGGLINGPIIAIDSNNLTALNSIYSPYIPGVRGIISLNNGRTMVVTSNSNNTIVFFNRINSTTSNYTFAHQQTVNYAGVHGLIPFNDSYFYATSYTNNSIYSYTAVQNSTSWTEKRIIDASMISNVSGGTFMTFDECGRYWFSLETSVIQIFDNTGSWLGIFNLTSGWIMNTLIADNYVMYFSDRYTSWSRIIRIDPHIEC